MVYSTFLSATKIGLKFSIMYSSVLNQSLHQRRGLTNFIRLAAAIAVLISHSGPLSGFGFDLLVGRSALGEVAVSTFFVFSGYFVFSSGIAHTIKDFMVLRFARLFPALLVTNFLLAFVIGPFFSLLSNVESYWGDSYSPFSYFFYNSVLLFGLQARLADLFSEVPYQYVVNGSLWTLPTELKCYALCALVALLVKLSNGKFFLYLSFFSVMLLYVLGVQGNEWVNAQVPLSTSRLVLVFLSGALVTYFKVGNYSLALLWLYLPFAMLLVAVWSYPSLAPFLYCSLIPVIAHIPLKISAIFRFLQQRDFSYGAYLWAFPIQQVIMQFDLVRDPYSLSVIATFFTLLLAAGSWYLVENPSIRYARSKLNILERGRE